MKNVPQNKSARFFDDQFRRQIREQEQALNPFEIQAIDYLTGTVLDLGCGLGNLSLKAGQSGHRVVAVDASQAAVARINDEAKREELSVQAIQADIETWSIDKSYDTIVAIGLLMFFRQERSLELLSDIQTHVNSDGRAVVNVLLEGTTFLDMFTEDNYYLFPHGKLEEQFAGWKILSSRQETFPAPNGTRKEFSTVIAQKSD
jgi:tellurite methyltransferase